MCSCGHLCAQVCVRAHMCVSVASGHVCMLVYMLVCTLMRVQVPACMSARVLMCGMYTCVCMSTHMSVCSCGACVYVCACEFMCLHATRVCHCMYVPVYLGACTYVHMLVCAYVLICLSLTHAGVYICAHARGVCMCACVCVTRVCLPMYARACRHVCVCALVPVSPTGMSVCICVCPCIWGRTSMCVHVNEWACVFVHTSMPVCACACMTNVYPHLLDQSSQGRVPSYQLVSGALGTAVVWLESSLTPLDVLSPLSLCSVWVLSVSPAAHLLRHREHFFAALSPPGDHCSLGPAGSGFLGSRPPMQLRAPGLKVGACVWA